MKHELIELTHSYPTVETFVTRQAEVDVQNFCLISLVLSLVVMLSTVL